ncbi:genetic competence negative regulator [Mesobacillus sp. AQ2]|jgi:adapter protein MecA 1/2|uniref:genetic competence negative regulator n=1 Tax=Bacillaceae TaxID=186817 RepID=UPI00119F237A|nr:MULTISPECIES: genetic competence negative regulator [Bacillaceae]MCM3122227.1 genetic competence negative regulator [Mesobacillus sp. MER 33]MCM3232191.1 genetic competence negative regulator [Mesobacillus sp. MER 48]WHX39138.1 genetic competence negative regulator [Mesobacillus sp. AQ2]
MRLERLTTNKIKIFLTIDDLSDRGLTKEDIWKDSLKWHQLFHDMLEEASEEFDLDIIGSVAVEIFSLHTQGMVMIITMIEQDEDEEQFEDGIIEMQVTVDGSEEILFQFDNIEDVIQLAKRLMQSGITGGSLHYMNDQYYLLMNGILPEDAEKTVSLLAEYGVPSILSIHRLLEYGKEIMEESAVETLVHYF